MITLLLAVAISPSPATVIGMDGLAHNPLEKSGGKPQAFIFVNHDCPICNAYSPEFARLEKSYGAKVKIHLVFSEPEITPTAVRRYENMYSLSVPAWIDAGRRFAFQCGATVVPQAVLFDAAGRKVWTGRIDDQWASLGVRRGVATSHDLRDALASLAKGKRPTLSAGKPVGCFILSPDTP